MSQQLDDRRVGAVINGKYRVEKLIAQGGFSSVYRGVQLGMERPVAIKVLELQQEKGVAETWLKRFEREARLVSQLSNPNTITIYDFGREDDFLYIVMEYVRGRSLARQIRKHGAISAADSSVIALAILSSVDEAHQLGVLHRDLKPSNIMLGRDYNDELIVKVLDFGVAKVTEPSLELGVQLTQAGTFVGTPRYASPEQMRREDLTAASDIYGVGLILWECLTGGPPVPSTDFPTCVAYHLGPDPWQLPASIHCPASLANVVHHALLKDHNDRYQTCKAMIRELEEVCEELSPSTESARTQVEMGVPEAVAAYLSHGPADDSLTSSNDSLQIPSQDDGRPRTYEAPSSQDTKPQEPNDQSEYIREMHNGSEFQPQAYFALQPDDEDSMVTAPYQPVEMDTTPTERLEQQEAATLQDQQTESLAERFEEEDKPARPASGEIPLLAPAPKSESPRRTQQPRKKKGVPPWMLVLIVTSAVAAAAGVGFQLMNSDASSVAVDSVTTPTESPKPQPPLVPADTLLLAAKAANWQVGKVSVDDLGDVMRHTAMVMKEDQVASITIYECADVEVAIALLNDTQSNEEAVAFGRTLIRIAPGPSSKKSGVQKLTAMYFTFRSMMEKKGEL